MYKFNILTEPRTKKNHQEIGRNYRTGKPFIKNGRAYKQYVLDSSILLYCEKGLKNLKDPIDTPINIKAIYYMKTRGKVDINNLHSCLTDILVLRGIIKDDNCKIVISLDGSRVRYDKENPRTEVEITEITNEEDLAEFKKWD